MRRDFTCARESQRATVNLGVRGAISAMWSGATDAMAALAQQVATLSTETHFPELGFDCVLHVLRYLPLYDALQLATVSSDWKSAANSRLAEQKILNLSYASGSVDSSLVSWLLGRMPRVCCLVLNDCVDVTLSAVSGTVFSLMARLETIDVSGTAIDAHAFFELWSLPAIFELHVSGCPRLVEMEMCQHARSPSATLLHLFLALPKANWPGVRLSGGGDHFRCLLRRVEPFQIHEALRRAGREEHLHEPTKALLRAASISADSSSSFWASISAPASSSAVTMSGRSCVAQSRWSGRPRRGS